MAPREAFDDAARKFVDEVSYCARYECDHTIETLREEETVVPVASLLSNRARLERAWHLADSACTALQHLAERNEALAFQVYKEAIDTGY